MPETGSAPADPDLLIDFRNVELRRDNRVLVGPLDWAVELDERWVIVGPNGAGKTSLLRIAAAAERPSSGVAFVLGERLGRVQMTELQARIGLTSSALAQRVPGEELVRDLVVSAGYAVLGRWRERYEDVDCHRAISTRLRSPSESVPKVRSARCSAPRLSSMSIARWQSTSS